MRHELKDHIGELVTMVGAPTGKKKLGNFLYHRPLLVIPTFTVVDYGSKQNGLYECEVAIKRIDTVDHLWISPTITKCGLYKYKFFEQVFTQAGQLALVGRIEEYIRADGTTDYGLSIVNEVEKEVCSFISIEGTIHKMFLDSECTVEFYEKARRILTSEGRPPIYNDIALFMDHYSKHVLKRYEHITSLLGESTDVKRYSYEIRNYLHSMSALMGDVLTELDTLHRQLSFFHKKHKKRIERRMSKKKAKAKLKQRAVGFG